MSTYRRETWVDEPLEEVWNFHSRVSGLEAVTPGFVNLRVEDVEQPDGATDPDRLEPGTRVQLSVRPFGVGPRVRWTSSVVSSESNGETAELVDVMESGPIPEWRHAHRFEAHGDGTLVRDEVEYRLPGGRVGARAGPLAFVGFEPLFAWRHRRTRELLE